jgi:colanic acid biosynthesis protein WcaH
MIPVSLYQQIVDKMPIPCVDLVITQHNKILLVQRTQEPAKGLWWLPGGRIMKGETLEAAALRKAEQEVGLPVEIVKKIGVYEYFSDKSQFPIVSGTHAVVACFLVKAEGEINLDHTSSNYKWTNNIGDLDPYCNKIIRDSGILE